MLRTETETESARRPIIIALLLLAIAVTRLSSLVVGVHVPDATLAAMFLAGTVGVGLGGMGGFLLLPAAIDFLSMALGASQACMSPGYPLLFAAYVAMWGAGRLARGRGLHVALASALACIVVAHALTSGGYYLLSGRFADPSLAEFWSRTVRYFPAYLMNTAAYLLVGQIVVSMLEGRAHTVRG